ncbi:MAG: hypothetical protein IJQ34_09625 [Kiritimatiellae bacterium]|nr:hypothetical protein [Kiritimatiellia bacterium]
MKKMKPILLVAVLIAVTTAFGKIKIACIGDSITFGHGLGNREATSYPAQLQKMLDAKYPGAYEVRNFGNSGRGIYLDSMRGNQKRGFRWMKEHRAAVEWKPDLVICNLGINDNGEYIKEYTGGRKRGQFVEEYLALLGDYKNEAGEAPKFFIWKKLSPLTEGQKFYRSSEPFLMQSDLEEVAKRVGATQIDIAEPLREKMDAIFVRDFIHPNVEGARIIAETTLRYIEAEEAGAKTPTLAPRPELKGRESESWLIAGQSNMQKGWGEFNLSMEEKTRVKNEADRIEKLDIFFWDFNNNSWKKLTKENMLAKSAFGTSFAIRRAEATGKAIYLYYVAAGGAPTEAFLSEAIMCKVDQNGNQVYPVLAKIATNRHRLDMNKDFPCAWVAREYPRRFRNMDEGHWWPVSIMYDNGISLLKEVDFDGILWYQGESNATTCVHPDKPTPRDYQKETLLAIVDELRSGKNTPFIMMGLPIMNRPWEQYREVQKEVCAETGAIYVDTFGAGLGDERDVHPRDKTAFADMAAKAAAQIAR